MIIIKQFRIIAVASVVFVICIVVAYHNTSSLGYDKQSIIYYNSEGVDIMDYHIEYNDIKNLIYNIKKHIPDSFMTI